MLFNSLHFVLVFLPVVVIVFYALEARRSRTLALSWLVAASLFFYGWWNPPYVVLLLASVAVNFGLGRAISQRRSRPLLVVGIGFNLALIGFFKYANFFVDNVNAGLGTGFSPGTIILPLAISFFTFQQIAYLVDAYQQKTHEYRLLHYCLFVTFFPQLIAGPIVHHGEMMPQFMRDGLNSARARNIAIGLTIFAVGLWKKVVLADSIAIYANDAFNAADAGVAPTFVEAWGGALAYTLQLYFDFSGYSDMAIGLARLFGIRLPINFHSPYKAVNIIDFWRRWHMTLSRFLRDYLYFPLGGNRHGTARRYANIMTVMLLGGLWHGAGWTFVVWGGLHGLYLCVNRLWQALRPRIGLGSDIDHPLSRGLARAVTFFCVVVAWVPFRAESFETTATMLSGMAGLNGIVLPQTLRGPALVESVGFDQGLAIAALLAIVWFAPNTQQWMSRYRPAIGRWPLAARSPFRHILWRPAPAYTLPVALFAVVSLVFMIVGKPSEFLYFQF
jgi:alginate O-acetyltransferase complex protein AlgI